MAFLTNVAAIVLAARFLGVNNFGLFSSILAIVSILSKFADFGIEPIIFREFSKNKENYILFSSSITLRLLLFIILIVVFNLLAPFLSLTTKEIILSNILFLTIVFSSKMIVVRELLSAPFKVNLKMHYPMSLQVLDNLILLGLIFFIPSASDPVLYFVIIYSLANLPGFFLMFYFLYKKFGYKYKFTLHQAVWVLKESLPLFGYVILTTIFLQIDVVILSYFKGNYDVGIYSAGVRLTMPLSIIPGAIVTTVFPILVKRLADKASTEFLTNLVIKLLFFISFVLAAVFSFESREIVTIIFGTEYSASALSASILYWCQIFLFFAHYSLNVLIADNRQHYNFLYSAVQVIINLIFAFLLIPSYSFAGAAIAKLIASFISFIFILYALNKFGFTPSVGRYKVLIWSILIALSLWAASYFNIIIYLIISAVCIVIITIILRLFNDEEIIMFFRLINREAFGRKFITMIKFLPVLK